LIITNTELSVIDGDLIQVFKIFKVFDNIQHGDFFSLASTELRGHEFKVYTPQVHLDIRKNFFSVRIVSVYGTVYQLHYYVATMSILLKIDLTVTFKIGDTNKLLASFPL